MSNSVLSFLPPIYLVNKYLSGSDYVRHTYRAGDWGWMRFHFCLLLLSHVDSFRSHGQQHTRLCPSLSPGVCSDSCPLSRWCHPTVSSSIAFNLSKHWGLFQLVGFSHQVAKVLELQLQHQSAQWIFRIDSFRIDSLILQSNGLSRAFSSTMIQKHLRCSAFFMVQL